MGINHLEDVLCRMGLEFAIQDIGKLSYYCYPLISTKSNGEQWGRDPGFYFYLFLMNSPGEVVDDHYSTNFLIEIVKTSDGFELKGIDIDTIKQQQGEAFFNYIEQQLEKHKLRLLFLYPQIEIAIQEDEN